MVSAAAPVETEQLKHHILSNNRIVVTRAEIPPHPMLQLIFTPIARWEEIPSYLQEIFASLYQNLTGKKQAEEEASVVSSRSIDLEREFIVQYHKTVTRLQDRLQQVQQMTVETCFRLLRNLARSISVAFSGEPLSGLQVMGVLETRALDFENLIILSFNEGILPQQNRATSFIPYTLRKGFGLPTYEQQDGTFAYHFYRMISRAKRIYLLYDTRTEEMQTGEVSRYFYQLKYLYKDAFQIREQIATYDVAAPQVPPVSVIKNEKVMRKLEAFRAGNERSLSASLVNNYINCPLQFYFTAVEGLSEEEAVEETVEADVFGSIFHRLMESLYNRYREMVITPDLLTLLAKDESHLDGILQSAFARYYFRDEDHPRPLQGQHYLIGEILKSYVKQTLEMDKQFTPFTYIASEYRFRNAYRVNEELELNFKGSIDRVDQVGKSVRIIDYKTGKGDTRFRNMESLFDATKANRPYQILQVLIYGLFYLQKNPGTLISPALYYLRSVYDQSDPVICFDKHPIQDLSLLLPEFRQHFDALLEEVFDPAVPFTQTKNSRNCEWCAFRELCNR